EGKKHEFDAPDDIYIPDAAETAGVDLPFSCRAGARSTCAAQMVPVMLIIPTDPSLTKHRWLCLLSKIRLHHPLS
ncbi:2Fe-2S iron-sulfur cluster binding domain, partial [Musa troglodytarum]